MKKISANIKFLRKKRNLTQQQFADLLSIKRSMIGAYEEDRASPKMDNMKQIANYFGITVDELVSEKITDKWLDERDKKKEKENEINAGNLRVLSITVDQNDNENIELVPVKASAGYVNGYSDPEFVRELPKFHLPMLQGGTFRAFEIKGDSMLPIQPGSIVVGEYLDDWKQIKTNETYVLISKNDGIVYKRIITKSKESKSYILKSDNKAYEPYNIDLDEILEIWKAKAYISTVFPEPEQEMSISQLTNIMLEMQKKISNM
ncbi:MAG: XRE family transcriptional regulator [bacterium]|jgi:transcriptional regulator with XRE-family HTH domain